MTGELGFGSLGVIYTGPYTLIPSSGGGSGSSSGGGSGSGGGGNITAASSTKPSSGPDPIIVLNPPQIILPGSDSPSGFSAQQDVTPVLVNDSNVDYDITVGLSDSPRLEDDLSEELILTTDLNEDLTEKAEEEGEAMLSSELDEDLTEKAEEEGEAILSSELDEDLTQSDDDEAILTQQDNAESVLRSDLSPADVAASTAPLLILDPGTAAAGSDSAPVLQQQALDETDAERSFVQAQLDQARDVEATLPEVRPPDGSPSDVSAAALAERLRQVKRFMQGQP